jgi:lysophospholipase
MRLDPAPFYGDVAHGPDGGAAFWLKTSDKRRLRVGLWPRTDARGTVLIFPGRTEFAEKYGQTAARLASHGLASMAIDWRGQGLSDRLLDDTMVGHVDRFSDYQKDVDAMLRAARELKLPRPFFLIAHSMGGAIGLRATMEGLPVQAAVFTGPMWGIRIAAHLRPAAWLLSHVMPVVGRGSRLPPGTSIENYILTEGFEDNLLTRDARQFEIMREQLEKHPDLALGGPSFVWLREALRETRQLRGRPAPNIPCVTYLGSNERIVDVAEVHRRMSRWNNGRLEIVEDGEHEVLMEAPRVADDIVAQIAKHFLGPPRK